MNSVSARLSRHFSKRPLKWDFLDIYLTTFFRELRLKNTSAVKVIFYFKMFNIEFKFRKLKKKKNKKKTFFCFWDNFIWKCSYKFSLWRREYLLSAVNGLTNSRKILQYHSERHFQPELLAEESINMVKIQSFRFQQCFRPFIMLLLEMSSKMGLFRHLSNHVFRSP